MTTGDVLTVLLAEDDDGHARLTEKSLQRSGLATKIVRVSDGGQVLDFVRNAGVYGGKPRLERLLVLLDLKMPVVDGYSVLRELKEDPETRAIPVIVITTTDDEHDIAFCHELGCVGFITKPVRDEIIAAALQQIKLYKPPR